MARTLPQDKPIKHFFSKDVTLEDLCYAGNSLIANGLKLGGAIYAVASTSQNHIRDGILIFVGGKLLDYGYEAVSYLRELYKKS
jgi:hypothetical protein